MQILIEIPDSEVPTKQEVVSVDLHFIDGKVCECTYPFQEPCADCVSRQAVFDLLQMRLMPKEEYKAIYELPSVTPAPRIGRWIPVGYDGYADGNPVYDWWECSECEWEHTGDEDTLTPYCPNCGAKMEEENDG